jgi:hypothetical protein
MIQEPVRSYGADKRSKMLKTCRPWISQYHCEPLFPLRSLAGIYCRTWKKDACSD